MKKKLFVLATMVFMFKFVGESDWITCKSAFHNFCGIDALSCSSKMNYSCLNNIERPPTAEPVPLTPEEKQRLRDERPDFTPAY